jgi:hypothetical protein
LRVFETAQLDFEGAAESLDRPREDDRTAGRILAKDLQAEFRGEFSNARDVVRMAPMRPREFLSGQVGAFLGQSSSELFNVGIRWLSSAGAARWSPRFARWDRRR